MIAEANFGSQKIKYTVRKRKVSPMNPVFKLLYICLASPFILLSSPISGAFAETNNRIYELRTYTINPGKLSQALSRLDTAKPLFIKHGMSVIAYWVPEDEKNQNIVIYLLGHENREAARTSWRGFHNDPQWHQIYSDSIANGSLLSGIESTFMAPTKFSPMQ